MLQETIEERRLDWLGNVARQPDTNLPKRLLTAWTDKPRKNCGQKLTLRDSNAAAINRMLVYNKIIESPSNECPSNSWVPLAKENSTWQAMVYKRRNDRVKLRKQENFHARRASQQAAQTPRDSSHFPNPQAAQTPHDSTSFPFPEEPHGQTSPPPIPPPANPNELSNRNPTNIPPSLPPLNVLPSDMCARLASYMTDDIVRRVTGLR
jgi:hypothetical protein